MAMAVSVLTEDLIVEIMSWLPVKSLMRFRCVSKSWNSLIFINPTFVKLHLQRSPKNTNLLVTCRDHFLDGESAATPCSTRSLLRNPSSIFDNCHRFDRNYFFLDSCNGLVCLHGTFSRREFTEHRFQFWNPATRILSKDSPPLRLNSCDYKLEQVFSMHGFGYDALSDTYKVVVVLLKVETLDWEVKVYRLGDTCWTSILPCPAFPVPSDIDSFIMVVKGHPHGRFVSGTVNWLPISVLMNMDHQWRTLTEKKEMLIFSYDLNKETCKYLMIPDALTNLPDDAVLGVLNGCMCLSHGDQRTYLVVWIMREFGDEKSWTQMLNVSFEHLRLRNIQDHDIKVRLMCLSENDDVLLLANHWNSDFVLYSQRGNRINRTERFGRKLPEYSYGCVQSLVSPY